MKKLFILPLILLMVVAVVLTSCGSTATTPTTTVAPATTQSVAPTTTTATAAPTQSAAPTTPTPTPSAAPTTTTAQPTPTPTVAKPLSTIKIGHLVDLTGPEAAVGQEEEVGLQLALDAIGNQIDGHPVQVITADCQGSPATATDQARKMVEQDKVVAIFGPTQIGEKSAVAGYVAQAGIPMITYSPTPLSLFQGPNANKWVIGVEGSDMQIPTAMADYLYNHLGYRTIDTLTQDNSAGRAFLNPIISAFKQMGGQVLASEWVPVPCPDFSPYLVKLPKADAFVAWDSGTDAIALLSQYYQMGLYKTMPIVGAFHGGFLDSFVPATLPQDAAASVVGDVTAMPYAPDSQSPENQAFVKAFTAKMGYPPGDDGSAGPYQAAQLFIAAVQATNGNTAPDALLTALTNAKISGPDGPTSFAPGTTCATVNVYILKVAQFGPGQFGYTTVYTYKDVPPAGYTGQ